ncbi:MAG: cysteine desulfurase family protein [Pirellulales bacterium]
MSRLPIYMDNHATTRVDPRVVAAMLPFFDSVYGNAGSVGHIFGEQARQAVDAARAVVASSLGASPREIIFTSGATESNNLAIRGVVERARRRGNHLLSVSTEHKSVLDPLDRLSRRGFEVTLLDVSQLQASDADPASGGGWLDPQKVEAAIRDETALVSVMLANNEIGTLQPLAEIGRICRQRGVPLHCDATQAVGKIPVDVQDLQVDLLSFTAHKIYGPKGIGGLYARRQGGGVRLQSQIDGGGQEGGLRSGTLNVPGIVGLAAALELCLAEMPAEAARLSALRNRLHAGLTAELADVTLNGPPLDASAGDTARRLPGNLNLSFAYVDGEALMMSIKDLAVSSGSACTSANPEPSHVLRALGIGDDLTRASLRFGLGRFNTAEDVEFAISAVSEAVRRLRKLSSMA